MYIPKYFTIKELVPEEMVELPERILWGLFDDRMLYTADKLREQFGPAEANNWSYVAEDTPEKAINHYRGFRPFDVTIGAKYSQHRFGRALDLTFKNVAAEEVRQYIIAAKKAAHPKDCAKYITAIELNVDWLHFDVRYHQLADPLMMFHK